MKIPNNPRRMGVPHDTWRPNQKDILEKFVNSRDKYTFAELSVGSGKTSVAVALGNIDQVTVCVHTLALLTQYEQKYGFAVIRGRQEYECADPKKIDSWKRLHNLVPLASDCTQNPPWKCKYVEQCPYHVAKMFALTAQRTACTYRYMALSEKMKERGGILVFDEAHDSAEELIRFNQIEMSYGALDKYRLPSFPLKDYGSNVIDSEARASILDWTHECVGCLVVHDDDDSPQAGRMKRMAGRISHLAEVASKLSFLEVTDTHIRVMALDANRVAKKIFAEKRRMLLMSGTIGSPEPLAKALGIKQYASHSFPHPIPANRRTVDNLNMPRMVKRILDVQPENYQLQVDKIWEWIQLFPYEWRGTVLSTSYAKIKILHEGIARYNNGKRRLVVQQPGDKVNDVVQKFVTDVQDSDIMIGTVQGMGTGIDLYGDLARWIVLAGVPHINPTDRYMQARRDVEGGIKYQRWLVYNAVAQASGRVTRGALDKNGEILRNYVAIADGSALSPTAMTFYPDWFTEAIK